VIVNEAEAAETEALIRSVAAMSSITDSLVRIRLIVDAARAFVAAYDDVGSTRAGNRKHALERRERALADLRRLL
jgi:hypothetical protein